MPLFEYMCQSCGHVSEQLIIRSDDQPLCPDCGGGNLTKLVSATSSASGVSKSSFPGAGDTTCCGSAPGAAAGCAGPGSCCGRH